jgi:hypothetical protein
LSIKGLGQTEVDYLDGDFLVLSIGASTQRGGYSNERGLEATALCRRAGRHFVLGRDEHQICRLQIAVNHSALFRRFQCSGDLLGDVNGSADIQWPRATNAFLKRLALDQFHRVEALPCLLANSELEYGGDVLVSQRGGHAGFAHKKFVDLGASPGHADLNDFQGSLALERRVNGTIRHAHRSAPKLVKTSVRTAFDFINSEALVALDSVQG